MSKPKVSVFRRGSRWGYMTRVDGKITKSGSADTKPEAEKAGVASPANPQRKRKKASRKASRKATKRATRKAPRRKAKRKVVKRAAKKRAKTRSRSKVSAAASTLSEYGHGETQGRAESKPKPKSQSEPARGNPRSDASALRAALKRDR